MIGINIVNHWKCRKCGSMNVERKSAKRFEAEAILHEAEDRYFWLVGKDNKRKFKENMKILTKRNMGLVLATLCSAIIGSMVQVVATNPNIRLYIFIGAIIGVIVGTITYERG